MSLGVAELGCRLERHPVTNQPEAPNPGNSLPCQDVTNPEAPKFGKLLEGSTDVFLSLSGCA